MRYLPHKDQEVTTLSSAYYRVSLRLSLYFHVFMFAPLNKMFSVDCCL